MGYSAISEWKYDYAMVDPIQQRVRWDWRF